MEKNKELTQQGFTLVELSIVLIIIGFIIAGVAAGQNLMQSARLNAVISEIQTIQTAANTFLYNYQYLPGDFPKAGQIWPSSTCLDSAVNTGCNGDGNGQIDINHASGTEAYRVWQHMSLAGVISGVFTGTIAESDQYPSKYNNAVYGMRFTRNWLGGQSYNFIEFATWNPLTACACGGVLMPSEAYSIDTKMDDGLADSGQLYGFDGDDGAYDPNSCSYDWQLTPTPNYNLSGSQNNIPSCRLLKKLN